ncbi:MAG: hypothetical protein MJ213_01740 [Bacilli bacterium]|nr:hypothetical protein [Bacilli bacterium]
MDFTLAKKKMRKCRDILTTTGYAIIILVLWDFVKGIIYLNWSIPSAVESVNDPYAFAYIIFVLVELVFCVTTGLIFSKIGRGNKAIGTKILVLSILLSVFALTCAAINIATVIIKSGFDIMTSVIFVEDILFLYFSFRNLYSVITIIKLSKTLKEQDNEC